MALWQRAVPLLLCVSSMAEMNNSELRSARGFQTKHTLVGLQYGGAPLASRRPGPLPQGAVAAYGERGLFPTCVQEKYPRGLGRWDQGRHLVPRLSRGPAPSVP